MKYTIENDQLRISVNSLGAELCSVVCKKDGVEHIWEGKPGRVEWASPDFVPLYRTFAGRKIYGERASV